MSTNAPPSLRLSSGMAAIHWSVAPLRLCSSASSRPAGRLFRRSYSQWSSRSLVPPC